MNFLPGWHGAAGFAKSGVAVQTAPTKTATGTLGSVDGGGTVSPGLPAGTVANDYLILLIMGNQQVSNFSVTGYTSLSTVVIGAQNNRFSVFYRKATGSDSCSFTASGSCAARITGYRGVNTSTPFENTQAAVDITTDGISASYASFSSSGVQRTCLQMFGERGPTASTPDTGWTEDMDTFFTASDANYALQIDEKVLPTASGCGVGTHTLNATPSQSGRVATMLVPV